ATGYGLINLPAALEQALILEGTTTYVGPRVFYNDTPLDDNTPGPSVSDDNAVDTTKTPLLEEALPTRANITTFAGGLNGLMIDIINITNPGAISAADFTFQMGTSLPNAANWALAPAPASVAVRTGDGRFGSDRITLIWSDDNAVSDAWFRVTVKANARTGLDEKQVFIFGNLAGDYTRNGVVDLDDYAYWRSRFGQTNSPSADGNANGIVDSADYTVWRDSLGQTLSLATSTVTQYIGSHIFYNNSALDGFDDAANENDDNAVDTRKQPLASSAPSDYRHFTSSADGITGVMVDIANIANPQSLSASDFIFRTGDLSVNTLFWDAAPAPASVTVRLGAGVDGSDRVTITWSEQDAVKNAWLEVTIKENVRTGLATQQVFLYGNLVGDYDLDGTVNNGDYATWRANFGGVYLSW
ncbi:MAG: hypothetical protein MI741_15850, partial [Rhodospirillales bacterium]|nr:hypothetical protein [Rhodospirillales bacterium]